jgi:phage terminase Nu1 subunit (DNA packaging protein)
LLASGLPVRRWTGINRHQPLTGRGPGLRSAVYFLEPFTELALVDAFYEARDANWLARVAVEGCEQKRAEELAELAVDLAIVALQLAAPQYDTRSMARLDARRGPGGSSFCIYLRSRDDRQLRAIVDGNPVTLEQSIKSSSPA